MMRHVSSKSGLLIKRFGNWICQVMHHDITRPVQGHYVCLECMRRHSVNF